MHPSQLRLAQLYLTEARGYADDILKDRIPACQWVKLAIERNERDLKQGGERGLYFDEVAAARVLVFFSLLKHYKGEWRGKVVRLEPWQSWIVSTVFGWKRANGKRRFRQVYEEVARKNGKTIKLAGIGGYGLLKDNEGSPEIYAAATTRDQSKRLWTDARKMLGYTGIIKKHIKIRDSLSTIECEHNDGSFVPLSRDSEAIDGTNPHFALVDELHAHPTRQIHDVLVSGMGARSQPILWEITTAGFTTNKEGSICLEQRDYTCQVLNGVFEDDEHFGIIYTLDDWKNEWLDPHAWVKANPNLEYQVGTREDGQPIMRGSVKHDYLAGQVTKAKNSPTAKVSVLTKNFNIWQSNGVNWCNTDAWKACEATFDLSDLEQATRVYGGLDLGYISDLASLVLIGFMPDDRILIWHRSWVPQDTVEDAVKVRRVPYDRWIEDGHLVATVGTVTDYNWIKYDLIGNPHDDSDTGLFGRLNIVAIGVDRWNSSQLVNDLKEAELNLVGFGQGYQSMAPAMQETERLYLSQQMYHNGDPVLAWAMNNVVAVFNPALDAKPDKQKSNEKIDPAVALMIAVGTSMGQIDVEPEPQLLVF